jgi:aspartate kinase
LGGALGASEVCLFKADVDGFYSADPHAHRDARRFTSMSHRVALGLARAGARVLNEKAAELADRLGLTLIIRPAFSDGPGTWVSPVDGSKPSGTTVLAGGTPDEVARLEAG